jgi:hypothetical protein
MYDPEQIDALIAERDRLRGEVEHAQTLLAEWEAIVGMPLVPAVQQAIARVDANEPYALAEVLEEQRVTIIELRDAFDRVAKSRNEWRSRAKRAGVRSLRGDE